MFELLVGVVVESFLRYLSLEIDRNTVKGYEY